MTKVFKHKTLWWIAEKEETLIWICKIQDKNDYNYIDIKLIEADSNREEVVENDWVDNIIEGLQVNKAFSAQYREIIEKHCPPLLKKFTREDIDNWYNSASCMWTRGYIEWFLIKHWLLEE